MPCSETLENSRRGGRQHCHRRDSILRSTVNVALLQHPEACLFRAMQARTRPKRCKPVQAVVEARFQAAHGQQHAVQILIACQNDHRRPRPWLPCCDCCCREQSCIAAALNVDHLTCREIRNKTVRKTSIPSIARDATLLPAQEIATGKRQRSWGYSS